MEQIYWLSTELQPGTETRNLLYVYGRFCYAGPVITEPIRGVEYLPGVLQGIQAVQGQIPYMCEVAEMPEDSAHTRSLRMLKRAVNSIHAELTRLEGRMAELVEEGNIWLDSEETSVYFEFETQPGYSCNSSDVVFLKTYRGEVMLTIIWYGPTGSFFVTLSPASGEEQSLVDTYFPAIFGKRRGVQLAEYANFLGYDEGVEDAYAARAAKRAASGSDGKDAEEEADASTDPLLNPETLFYRCSAWEASEDVPDPDEIRARDEAEAARVEAAAKAAAEASAANTKSHKGASSGGAASTSTASTSGATLDVSGGDGYAQVYAVMQPMPGGPRTALPGGSSLVPREAVFRFGSWIYAGGVEFPVENLTLGDVPYLLPALQKQQGRLGYLSEATSMPADHPMADVIASFMAAVGILKHEMEDSQSEVAALAEQSMNAWIDADWAASFFELSFQQNSVKGRPAAPGVPARGLAGSEVIAAKIYLFEGTGIILHCVWFQGSMYCVLADSVEDLPLLDVAFPDVTARNRVVQVRAYSDATASKLSAAFPGAPMPTRLRVWEGRRRGVKGVGFGAKEAFSADKSGTADVIREKARARAEREATAAAAAAAATSPAKAAAKAAASPAPAASDGKTAEPAAKAAVSDSKGGDTDEEEDLSDLYNMAGAAASAGGSRSGASGGAGKAAAASTGAAKSSSSAAASSGAAEAKQGASSSSVSAGSMPTQLMHSVARAPHHLAPMNRAGPTSLGAGRSPAKDADAESSGVGSGNRLVFVGARSASGGAGAESKDEEAPWDASGRPKDRR